MNDFRQCLETGHFAITAELTPPRGASLEALSVAAESLKPVVTAINLTDGAGARVRLSSLAAAIHVRRLGVEPVLQLTCRDRNRIALQSDALGAAAFDISNILVLTGDGVERGDHDDAQGVFDLDSRTLLSALTQMSTNGQTMSGNTLDDAPEFFLGAADTPFDPAVDWQPDDLYEKQRAGARFVQSQYCFDMELLDRYMSRLTDYGLTEKLYFLVGLGPLRSADRARWMRDNLHGTVMPDGIIRRLEASRDARQEGIQICAEMLYAARQIPGVSGAHLMAPGQHQEIVESISLAGTF